MIMSVSKNDYTMEIENNFNHKIRSEAPELITIKSIKRKILSLKELGFTVIGVYVKFDSLSFQDELADFFESKKLSRYTFDDYVSVKLGKDTISLKKYDKSFNINIDDSYEDRGGNVVNYFENVVEKVKITFIEGA